ncbi:hypothetical protein [Fictibacillus sp. BK138]|uniref:hypothetical protein n=1 Tax=Fictibacillus sp. BK138 TaxID=2512121 RepID=UPI001029CF07|nr:hypothetical protein [Fictibacillus sp. BK138]RZT15555.1 hypothetical protein EV282_3760 [Fictibacillus sp. BK138]
MAKENHFFATRNDLVSNLMALEENRPLKYIRCGSFEDIDFIEYTSIFEFQDLGINISGNRLDDAFLVIDQSTNLNYRAVEQERDGSLRYFIDQSANDDSIVFSQGGIYKNDYFIWGRISSVKDNEHSKSLYKDFINSFKKHYKKVKGVYFGQEAYEIAPLKRLITMDFQQDFEYDFKI